MLLAPSNIALLHLSSLVEKFIEFKLLSLLVNIFEFNKLSSLLLIIKNLSIETGFQNILCYCPGTKIISQELL